jgi:hypothetical protein
MKLRTRKMCVLSAVALAAAAATWYASGHTDLNPPYSEGPVICRSVDTNGQPQGCVAMDTAHFSFADLHGM